MTELELDIKEIKESLAEIKDMLRKAGLTGRDPQKVLDFNKKAREIKERLDRRNGGTPNQS